MRISFVNAAIMVPHFEADVPLNELVVIVKMPGGGPMRSDKRCKVEDIKGDLIASPFMDARWKPHASIVRDIASNFVRASEEIEYDELLAKLMADTHVSTIVGGAGGKPFVEDCVRMIIANRGFKVSVKHAKFLLRLSHAYKAREKERTFAASLAEELQALSDRMAAVVPHMGEQGRFREDLFRAVLEKNLPTRYHVATGFIQGCPRQLDILIYDQVDYAPVFREAGVVVVPPEAVRAVIEVKTTLNSKELEDSLDKIADVSMLDNRDPPFFKGIFAYRGPVQEKTVTKYLLDYYRAEQMFFVPEEETSASEADDQDQASDIDNMVVRDNQIMDPFAHLTAMCIDRSYFADMRLISHTTEHGPLVSPTVRVISSKTGLTPQTALFVEALSEHLNLRTLKPRQMSMFTNMLAYDLDVTATEPVYGQAWGPYIWAQAQGRAETEVTQELEQLAARVDAWRNSGNW